MNRVPALAHATVQRFMSAAGGARTRTAFHQADGTTAAQLALVLPVFLFLILGAFDLGRAVILNNAVGEGARDGARTAQVLIRQNHYSFTSGENTQIQSTAIKPVSAASGSSASALLPVVSTDANGYRYVTVSVTATYQPVIGTFIKSLRSKTFQGTSTLAVPCGKC